MGTGKSKQGREARRAKAAAAAATNVVAAKKGAGTSAAAQRPSLALSSKRKTASDATRHSTSVAVIKAGAAGTGTIGTGMAASTKGSAPTRSQSRIDTTRRVIHGLTYAAVVNGIVPGTGASSVGAGSADAAATTASAGTDAAAAAVPAVWPSMASLKPRADEEMRWNPHWYSPWEVAVAPAVMVLERIVAHNLDMTTTRIPPCPDAIVDRLRGLGRDDGAARFKAAWEELGSTPDGRAVIAVCGAAAAGGALLGRIRLAKVARNSNMDSQLAHHYKGQEILPVLQAALRYYRYRAQPTAATPVITAVPEPSTTTEWVGPSLKSLLQVRDDLLDQMWGSPSDDDDVRSLPSSTGMPEGPPQEWAKAVAPAVAVVLRIIARFFPTVSSFAFSPLPDRPVTIVEEMQREGLDEGIPSFLAAWEELGSTPDGRAVFAVYRVAAHNNGMMGLGYEDMVEIAADPGLEDELQKIYHGLECLPVLLATTRYYREQAARGEFERARDRSDRYYRWW